MSSIVTSGTDTSNDNLLTLGKISVGRRFLFLDATRKELLYADFAVFRKCEFMEGGCLKNETEFFEKNCFAIEERQNRVYFFERNKPVVLLPE